MEEKLDQVSVDFPLIIDRLDLLFQRVLDRNPAASLDVEVVTAEGVIKIGVNRLHNLCT